MDLQESQPSPASQGSAEPRPTAAPLGFTAGLLCFILSFASLLAAGRGFDDYDDLARWTLLAQALPFASYVLLLAGSLEMLRTTVGAARTGAKLAVAATSLLLTSTAACTCFQVVVTSRVATAMEFPRGLWEVASSIATSSWHALAAAVVVIAWGSPRARKLALLALAGALVAHPYAFSYALLDHRFVIPLAWAAQLLLLWSALRASVPEPEMFGGWLRAGQALARLGQAMSLRVAFAALTVVLSLVYAATAGSPTFEAESLGEIPRDLSDPLLTLNRFAGPAGLALATAVAISGALAAGGLATFLAPRRRFYAAAALFTVIFSARVIQLSVAYLIFPQTTYVTLALPVLMPMLETAALALVALGCRRLAEQLESAALIERAAHTWLLLKVAQSFAVIAPLLLVGTAGVDGLAPSAPGLAVLLASAAPIVTMLALSRLCRAMAQEIELRGELPAAFVQR